MRADLHIIKNLMMISITTITCIIFFLMPQAWCVEYSSIIPPDRQISDAEANHMLALLLSQNDKDITKALEIYRILIKEIPAKKTLWVEFAGLLARTGKQDEAISILKPLYDKNPNDVETGKALLRVYIHKGQDYDALLLAKNIIQISSSDIDTIMDIANLEARLGHAEKCRGLYQDALKLAGNSDRVLIAFADQMNSWGDFDRVERTYRDILDKNPDNSMRLKLAWVLTSSQRYEEADYQYRLMLKKSENREEILLYLAELRYQEKKYNEALTFLDQINGITDENLNEKDFSHIIIKGLLLKAKTLDRLKKYEEAGKLYNMLAANPGVNNTEILIEAGKNRLKSGDTKQANYYFEQAIRTDPNNISSLYYVTGEKKVATPEFIQSITSQEKYTPMELLTWAELFSDEGFRSAAITILDETHVRDPACFPVTMRLAELLAADHRYSRSVELLENLEKEFPGNYKIMITLARVLGWSGEYEHSITIYSELQKNNPDNPVLIREKARTAAWGRMMEKASGIYAEAWKTPVNKRLLSKLKSESAFKNTAIPEKLGNFTYADQEKGSIYSAYEFLRDGIENRSINLTGSQKESVEDILLDLLPAYKIQKGSYLESSAKYYAWDNKLLHALEKYKELIYFQPGNEEALFDYAQINCSLNMCDKEALIYRGLLDMDPFHSLAADALKRNTIRSHPSLSYNYSYWDEEGRGILSGIDRSSHDLKLDLPIWYRYIFRFAAHRWIEKSYFDSGIYRSNGYSAGFDGVFTPYLKGAIGWTHKDYILQSIKDSNTGFINIWLNFYDYFNLGIGFDKKDEISNKFAIVQRTQSDQWWISVDSDLTHNLDINITARKLQYSDSNDGYYHSMAIGYSFSEYPGIFKVILNGEYRDTGYQNIYSYNSGNSLINIIHPYWTPDAYTSAGITLEWYHDISKLFFCGNQKHYYDLKLSFGPDSNNDFPLQIEAEYNYDFLDHWTFTFKGYFHRSDEWDAEGVWSTIQYRF
jgi:tetratricopeptide (TPR) repeat protein